MKTKTRFTLIASAIFAGILFVSTTGAARQSEIEAPPQLNDLEIAHIAYTSDNIDIRYAHLALVISEDPDVRAFAETMIRDHGAVNEKALELLQKLDVAPQDNPVSQDMIANADQIIKALMQLKGKAFDQRYAENELSYHRFVNHTVETQFIPTVQTPELKALLESALQTFKVHEEHAEMLNKKLNA
jgi:putative membrane protein